MDEELLRGHRQDRIVLIFLAVILAILVISVVTLCNPEKKDVTPVVPTSTQEALPTETIPAQTATETDQPTSTPRPTNLRPTATPHLHELPDTGRTATVTFYSDAYVGGGFYCGGGHYSPDDPTVAATGDPVSCGESILLCNEGTCINVVVKDRCGGCGPDHIDLSKEAFTALGFILDQGVGIVEVQ